MVGPENSHRVRKILQVEVWSAIWKRWYVTISVARAYFMLIFCSWWGEPPSILWIKWGYPRLCLEITDLSRAPWPCRKKLLFLSKPFLSRLDERCWTWPCILCIVKRLWDSSHDVVLLSLLHAMKTDTRWSSPPNNSIREMSQVKFWRLKFTVFQTCVQAYRNVN